MGSEISQHCRRQIIFHKKLNMAGDKLIIDPSKRVKNACITNNASSQALMAKLSDQELGLENSLNLRNNASEESIGIHIKSNVKSHNFVSRSEWITLAILTFVNLINYMDRYTIAGVLTSVQETYNIGNSEAGLLQTAFVASFMIFAPLFGYLGDRFNRNYVMIIGITIWAIATLLGSFMEDFTLSWPCVPLLELAKPVIQPLLQPLLVTFLSKTSDRRPWPFSTLPFQLVVALDMSLDKPFL